MWSVKWPQSSLIVGFIVASWDFPAWGISRGFQLFRCGSGWVWPPSNSLCSINTADPVVALPAAVIAIVCFCSTSNQLPPTGHRNCRTDTPCSTCQRQSRIVWVGCANIAAGLNPGRLMPPVNRLDGRVLPVPPMAAAGPRVNPLSRRG